MTNYQIGREFARRFILENGTSPQGGWIEAIAGIEEEILFVHQFRLPHAGRVSSAGRAALLEFSLGANDYARQWEAENDRLLRRVATFEACLWALLPLPLLFLVG